MTTFSKVSIKDMGYAKRNKICIPKEGMPHAHKACQKRERAKDSPYPKKKKKRRDDSYKGVHPPSTKNINIHTLAHLDQGL